VIGRDGDVLDDGLPAHRRSPPYRPRSFACER
jgi:hypothetical protein